MVGYSTKWMSAQRSDPAGIWTQVHLTPESLILTLYFTVSPKLGTETAVIHAVIIRENLAALNNAETQQLEMLISIIATDH